MGKKSSWHVVEAIEETPLSFFLASGTPCQHSLETHLFRPSWTHSLPRADPPEADCGVLGPSLALGPVLAGGGHSTVILWLNPQIFIPHSSGVWEVQEEGSGQFSFW